MSENDSFDDLSFDVDENDLAEEVRPDSTVTWGTDWTVDTIIGQLARGRFDLEPAFQRRDVWNDLKRSRFIESLLLGIPVPQLILAERRDARGKFIVLDGKQRLRSLQRFAGLDGPSMKLKGLQVLKHLNGLTYDDFRTNPGLEPHAAAVENQVVRAVVLRDWSSEALLYLTFLRLNGNVVGLSPQELRRALHPGPFMNYVMEYSASSLSIHKFLGRKGPDFRMRDTEILIRHIALTLRRNDYRGNLRAFLDESCEAFNEDWVQHQSATVASAKGFDLAIEATIEIFGKNAFKRYSAKGYEPRKNRAVLDIMAFYLQHEKVREECLQRAPEVKDSFERICIEDGDFSLSLTTTTKSSEAVNNRFTKWGGALTNISPSASIYI
ncbi:DUF262 domain-containing protein [Arthrobacter sp. TMS2-4]